MRRDIFQAIADPTRRAILVLIAVQAMTPNAIAEHFDITRSLQARQHVSDLNDGVVTQVQRIVAAADGAQEHHHGEIG